MSLWLRDTHEIPVATVRAARAAFPRGTFCIRVRDVLGQLFQDAAFAELFAARGRPGYWPWRLAVVSIMQFAEGLTDRQAADAVRGRIDWKYLLALDLEDPGFDASVLTEFRERLVETDSAQCLVFEAVLERLAAADLVASGGRQRTDSTKVLGAIRGLHRLELVGETLRAGLEAIAAADPAWLLGWVPADWFARYGPRVEAYRLPKGDAEVARLVLEFGHDGMRVLTQVYQAGAPDPIWSLPAVQVLRRVWVQQFYLGDSGLVLRTDKDHGRPPGSIRIVSPYDTDARYGVKRGTFWTGYKVQLSETCDPELAHLITYVETSQAAEADIHTTARVHDTLAASGLLPAEHLVDSAYVNAEQILAARHDHGVDLVGPVNGGHTWQEKNPDAFDIDRFTIGWDQHQATCPQGRTSAGWKDCLTVAGNPAVHIHFSKNDCTPCPVRAQCTQAARSARTLTLRPRDQHELLVDLRTTQATDTWKQRYAARAGVEGTVSQAARAFGLRRCRYRGLAKTAVQHVLIATAINLTRLDAWLNATPLGPTRTSHLAKLASTT